MRRIGLCDKNSELQDAMGTLDRQGADGSTKQLCIYTSYIPIGYLVTFIPSRVYLLKQNLGQGMWNAKWKSIFFYKAGYFLLAQFIKLMGKK